MHVREPTADTTWGRWFVRRMFHDDGFTDDGERAAVEHLDGILDGARVLDLGFGTGRTTSWLAPRAGEYVGIDVSPGMVHAARRRHPGVDLRVGDARRLDGLQDGSFDVVVFSFNGIDAIPHGERDATLREIRRVLVDGGHALLSMLNLDEEPPPAPRPSLAAVARPLVHEAPRHPRMGMTHAVEAALGFVHYPRVAARTEAGPDWAWRPMREHEFRFLAHYTRFAAAVRSLRAAGLPPAAAWSSTGAPLELDADRHPYAYSQFVCRATPPASTDD
jgi:ubiquinone/menaquinone biosynthesis C-methylase UbiE